MPPNWEHKNIYETNIDKREVIQKFLKNRSHFWKQTKKFDLKLKQNCLNDCDNIYVRNKPKMSLHQIVLIAFL